MATQTEQSSNRLDTLLTFISELLASYDKLEMSRKRYFLTVLLPALVVFVATIAAAILLTVPILVRLPLPLLGLLIITAAVVYPKIYISQRRIAIENQFHLVMTHMTVLSMTNIDRMEVFRTLAKEEEYGALAEGTASTGSVKPSSPSPTPTASRSNSSQSRSLTTTRPFRGRSSSPKNTPSAASIQ